MPQLITAWRVFLGSPSGLECDRAVIRSALDDFNHKRCLDDGAVFVLRGWSDVPGGVTRPQEKINDEVRASDFVVIVLHNRWGSPTGSDQNHSSGTAEEFDVTVEGLGDASSPIRDLLVLFKSEDPERIADPGEQLKKVLAFKAALEQSGEIYFTTFDDDDDLRRAIEMKLNEWLDEPEAKQVRNVSIRSTSVDIETPVIQPIPTNEILEHAADLQSQGLQTQAESLYALAAGDGDPRALLEYAKFMRRRGRFDRSIELNDRVLQSPSIMLSSSPGAISIRSECLSNLGIVRRKSGDLPGSVEALAEAVKTAKLGGSVPSNILVYALDNLGHSYLKLGRRGEARQVYEEASALRSSEGDPLAAARSLLNLARLHRQDGDLGSALDAANGALSAVDSEQHLPLYAHALAAVGEYYFLLGQFDRARVHTEKALEANRELGSPDGESIATLQLGRIELASGRIEAAESYADACHSINLRSGNAEGLVISEHLQGQVALAAGQADRAVRILESALTKAVDLRSPARESLIRSDLATALVRSGDLTTAAASEADQAVSLASTSGDELARRVAQRATEEVTETD